MMGVEYSAFVLLGFFASLISSVFGFGTALVVLAIGAHILPIKEAIALATVLFAVSTITKTLLFNRYINWKIVGIMSVSSLPFAYLGAVFLGELQPERLKQLLGLMLLLYIALSRLNKLPSFNVGTSTLIMGSAAYGFVSGLLGSGNIIKVVIFREIKIEKQAFVGAMAATSVLANLAKLSAYTQINLLTKDLYFPIIGLSIASFLAALTGKYLLKKLSSSQFSTGVQVILAMSAVALLL